MRKALLVGLLLATASACSEPPVQGAVRYADLDAVSINDRCPVRHDPLSDQVKPVFVNGRPLGFC
jgi:hypothetical protein